MLPMASEASPAAIRYAVSFPERETHYVSVVAILPSEGRSRVEVFMPVWTPGSYLIREYARHVEAIAASDLDGRPLPVSKTRKNRWTIDAGSAGHVRLTYRVYCRDMSVRTNWVEHEFALLNGAPTFITLAGNHRRPHEVQFGLPPEWTASVTGLPQAGNTPHTYLAPDYDTLVDSPVLLGNPSLYDFEVDGIPHRLANEGEDGVWDGPRAAADVRKIVEAHKAFWGSLPYERYVFLNVISEAGGGLEHGNSMCVMTNRWATSTRRAYVVVAQPGLARVLSRVEHQALAPRRTRAVRLREREPHPQPLDRRRHHRLLRAAAHLPGAPDYTARVSGRGERHGARISFGRYRHFTENAGQAGAFGRAGLVRCLDQALPPG